MHSNACTWPSHAMDKECLCDTAPEEQKLFAVFVLPSSVLCVCRQHFRMATLERSWTISGSWRVWGWRYAFCVLLLIVQAETPVIPDLPPHVE